MLTYNTTAHNENYSIHILKRKENKNKYDVIYLFKKKTLAGYKFSC